MASKQWVLHRVNSTPGRGSTTCWRWRWYGVEEGEILETTTDSSIATMKSQAKAEYLANRAAILAKYK